jgi:hypothetical protein
MPVTGKGRPAVAGVLNMSPVSIRAGGSSSVVKCLPTMYKALGLIPSTIKKPKLK